MTTIADNEAYNFTKLEIERVLLFTWKHVPGLEVALFKRGIQDFAEQCQEQRPSKAVIDATKLDQASPAVAWLRGQATSEDEPYGDWWLRDIVPKYNTSGIAHLAVATGDPAAPGPLSNLPEAVMFKMGYFPDLDAAVRWQP